MAGRNMKAGDHSTFWLLYGQYGATIDFETFCREFFPTMTRSTVKNRISMGKLPRPINGIFDVRDIADWWDECRKGDRVGMKNLYR